MAQFTLKGFTAQDVKDFALSTGWQEFVTDENGEEVANPVTAGQHDKNYFRIMTRNRIVDYRQKQARLAVETPAEPEIEVE